ncbi:Asp-tRNA(Asn)/Glu-tRNA(Gln) amidotransferase subunit GatA [Desulfothermobacter acidiphilus]|uniref:Asp-tRNA(Asn)/Glu-tRNA(Gln) amidotransferase subunit GatA n=1 Tax=Desulfothermobacter acidiphilus TaxID=1938353 RepID=UPI003F8BF37A
MPEELAFTPASELHQRFLRGEISAREIVDAYLERIKQVEPRVKAFLSLCEDRARRQAEELDRSRSAKEPLGPLAGIPVAIKDNLCVKNHPATCASKILANFYPPYDATVVRRLEEAGAIIIGKTNLDEFAMGSSTENSAFHPTANPWDLSRVPGGSSGGSAAAVAAGEVPVALGSDTGGSIRQPAAFCGVVGLKPTYGRVSRYGLIAFASSLDQIGPFGRTVEDCARLLQAIAGPDPQDSTSIPEKVPDYCGGFTGEIKGMRIGVPREYLGEGIAPEVRETVQAMAHRLAEQGAQVEETSLPYTRYALPAYYLVATAEASSNLARYDGVRYGLRVKAKEAKDAMAWTRKEGFGTEVKRRIMLGTYALSAGYYEAYYLKALKVRTLIKRDFDQAFARFDCLLTPTTPTPAFRQGEKLKDPLAMYFTDICTLAVNMAGLPAITVPAGRIEGLPVGVQFIAPPLMEERLFRVAWVVEQIVGFPSWRPPLEVRA